MDKQLEKMLRRVEKPARYIGGETNIIRKNSEEADFRFGFAFPDVYEIGMSYLGLQILYNTMNREDGVAFERIFAPAIDMEELMRQEGRDLFTLETYTPVCELDMVGFTLQYEMSFTNILNMLDLSAIPIRAEDRQDAGYPIIIAGGPCAYQPEPLADFIDAFLIGDGEELLPLVCREHRRIKGEYLASGRDPRSPEHCREFKDEYLRAIASMDGVYVPMFYRPEYNEDGTLRAILPLDEAVPKKISRALVSDLDDVAFPRENLVPIIDTVHDRSVVETFRGCTRGCRFCQAGMIYRPVRERTRENIMSIAMDQIDNTGHDELSLLSLSTSDYSDFEPMATELMGICKGRNVALSLPSLRLDSFSFRVLEEIQGYRKSGLTFAPEAGTQRLRDVINKNITEEDIYSATRQAIELGWETIKLYFMIGLPTETDEDLDGIAEIARKIVDMNYEIRGRRGGRFRVTVSVSNFVPKAHTPFQWVPQDSPREFIRKHDYLSEKLRIKGVTFNYHESNTSRIEAVFARGDRRCGRVLEEAWKMGCKFDSWSEYFDEQRWIDAFRACGVDPDFYTVRRRDLSEVLPWDHIDPFISREFLLHEYEKATHAQVTPDCREGCVRCGMNEHTRCFVNCEGVGKSAEFKQDAQGDGAGHGASGKAPEKKTQPGGPGTGRSHVGESAAGGPHVGESAAGGPGKYAMEFSKEGTACYSSHLDLMRIFKRSFKRAGIDLVHSQGFNPHPKMGFAQPLSLGYSSLSEFIEFETVHDFEPDEIMETMSRMLPEGIRLIRCIRIRKMKKTLASHTIAAAYEINIPISEGNDGIPDVVQARDIYMSQSRILAFKRQKKSKELKQVDIKPMIRGMEFCLQQDALVIDAVLDSGSASNLSPELVIDSLLDCFSIKTDRSEIHVVRKKLFFDTEVY